MNTQGFRTWCIHRNVTLAVPRSSAKSTFANHDVLRIALSSTDTYETVWLQRGQYHRNIVYEYGNEK